MTRPLLCLSLAGLLAGRGLAQIAYIKNHAVYVLPCRKSVAPPSGVKAVKVCNLWANSGDGFEPMGWVSPRELWLIRTIRKPDSFDHFSIYLVDASRAATPHKVADGCEPAISPDGTTMAYASSNDFNSDVWLLNLQTGRRTLKAKHAEQPGWSGDGKSFVYVARDPDFNGKVTIRTYPDWKRIRTLREQLSPALIFLSHDASKLAAEFHISRPKMGHTVFDIRTGKEVVLAGPDRFAPPLIDDWSPDEEHFLSGYRTINPNNDGAWIKNQLGITDVNGAHLKLLSLGYNGRFATDGQHILYISDHRTGMFNQSGDLMWESLSGGKSRTLASGVTDYVQFRHP